MKHCPLKSKLHLPAMHYINHVQSCHILTVFKFNFAFKLPSLHSYLSSVRTLAARPPTPLAWRAAAIATCPRAPPTSLREDSPRYSSSCKLSSVCVEGRDGPDDTVQTVTPSCEWMETRCMKYVWLRIRDIMERWKMVWIDTELLVMYYLISTYI